MKSFRLTVSKSNRLLGHFESNTPWAEESIREIARCLTDAGYVMDLLVADDERRLLESGPDGIRVLHREPIFKSTTLKLQ